MASSQLRRAETREYGQDPPVGILFSLSGMLSFIPAAASLAQRDGAPVPAPRCRAGTDRAGTARALPQPRL